MSVNDQLLDLQGLRLDPELLVFQVVIEDIVDPELGAGTTQLSAGFLALQLCEQAFGNLVLLGLAAPVNRPAINVDPAPPNTASSEDGAGPCSSWHALIEALHFVFVYQALKIQAIDPDVASESHDRELLALDHLSYGALGAAEVFASLGWCQ